MTAPAHRETARIVFGTLVALAIWELLGAYTSWGVAMFPAPSRILAQAFVDRELYALHGLATLRTSALGFLIGVTVAVAAAILFCRLPGLEPRLSRRQHHAVRHAGDRDRSAARPLPQGRLAADGAGGADGLLPGDVGDAARPSDRRPAPRRSRLGLWRRRGQADAPCAAARRAARSLRRASASRRPSRCSAPCSASSAPARAGASAPFCSPPCRRAIRRGSGASASPPAPSRSPAMRCSCCRRAASPPRRRR